MHGTLSKTDGLECITLSDGLIFSVSHDDVNATNAKTVLFPQFHVIIER